MKSKFTYFIILPIILILFLLTVIPIIAFNINTAFNSKVAGMFIVFLLIFTLFMFYTDSKQKIISVELKNNKMIINRFFGLNKSEEFLDNQIDGFNSSIVPTKSGSYNYIYIICKNKKIAKISDQYHKNINEMKSEIEKKYKYLGYKDSGIISELKDMFN